MGRHPSANFVDLTDKDPHLAATAMRIRKIRLHHQLTMREFADMLDMSASDIKRIEYGRGGPTLHQLRMIKTRFNVSYDYLLDGKK